MMARGAREHAGYKNTHFSTPDNATHTMAFSQTKPGTYDVAAFFAVSTTA